MTYSSMGNQGTEPTITGASVFAAMESLRSALAEVEVNGEPLGSAVATDPAGSAEAGALAVIILPPDWAYGRYGMDPSPDSFICQVAVIAPNTDMMVLNLLTLALGIANAIDQTNHATVSATAGTWPRGGKLLPAYLLSVSLSLQ